MSSVVTLYGMRELPEERASTLQVEWLDPKQNIGIEIEVEFDRDTAVNPDNLNLWTVKSDGSLRRGQEFVLSRPLRGDALSSAIEEFFHHNRVYKSPTSGTHIHVDMRDKAATLDVVKTMASIVVCIEPAIFGMFTEGREWCGYTNPITTIPEGASFSVFSERAGAEEFRTLFSPGTREYKYYGFNMLPLGRYGSVEFRYFNTAENADELIEWVQFCMAVKMAAVNINTRSSLKYYLSSEICWEEFLNKFFGQWRDRMLPFLPYKEVCLRWKQTRSRSRVGKTKPKRTGQGNKLKDTRFKKFFAIKVKDETTGKSKLVYDIESATANMPTRVFLSADPAVGSYSLDKRPGDFLVTNDLLWKWDAEQGRWVEVLFYALNPDRVTDRFRDLTAGELAAFTRAVAFRAGGGISQAGMLDLSQPSAASSAELLLRVGRMVARAMLGSAEHSLAEFADALPPEPVPAPAPRRDRSF